MVVLNLGQPFCLDLKVNVSMSELLFRSNTGTPVLICLRGLSKDAPQPTASSFVFIVLCALFEADAFQLAKRVAQLIWSSLCVPTMAQSNAFLTDLRSLNSNSRSWNPFQSISAVRPLMINCPGMVNTCLVAWLGPVLTSP